MGSLSTLILWILLLTLVNTISSVSSPSPPPTTVLILYAYSEVSPQHRINALYFLSHGLSIPPESNYKIDIIFTINGDHTLQSPLEIAQSHLQSFPHITLKINTRPNLSYDFGAHSSSYHLTQTSYTFYILLNASILGPLFHPWSSSNWILKYTKLLNSDVKLVGTTLNCNLISDPELGLLHLQSMFLVTDYVGMKNVVEKYLNPNLIFDNKIDAIYGAEIPLSQDFLKKGHSIKSISNLFYDLPISSQNLPTIKSICKNLEGRTLNKLGDLYYSTSGSSLVDPYELGFFKTNIESHPHNKLKFWENEIRMGGWAISLTGELRTFLRIWENIRDKLLGEFEGRGYVFMLINEIPEEEERELNKVIKVFEGRGINFILNFSKDDGEFINDCEYLSSSSSAVKSGYSQSKKLQENMNVIRNYEINNNIYFEQIIKSRPDLGFIETFNARITDVVRIPEINFWPINDQFAHIPRAEFYKYFTAINLYYKCPPNPVPANTGINDYIVYTNLKFTHKVTYETGGVIVRDEGGRCESLSKVRNPICQIIGGFDVFDNFGGEECSDYFNFIGRVECVKTFHDSFGDDISREDEEGEHFKSIKRRGEENPNWFNVFRDLMADYVIKDEQNIKPFWERDQEWYPLIINDFGNEQREVGYVGSGYVVTDNLIKALQKSLKCEAERIRITGIFVLDVEGCGVEEVMKGLEEGQVRQNLDCIGSCEEEDVEAMRRRINEKAVELVGKVEENNYEAVRGEEL